LSQTASLGLAKTQDRTPASKAHNLMLLVQMLSISCSKA
jgi:hypothetical protein